MMNKRKILEHIYKPLVNSWENEACAHVCPQIFSTNNLYVNVRRQQYCCESGSEKMQSCYTEYKKKSKITLTKVSLLLHTYVCIKNRILVSTVGNLMCVSKKQLSWLYFSVCTK